MMTTFDIFLEQTISEKIKVLISIGEMIIPTLRHGRVHEGGEKEDDDHLGQAVDEYYHHSVLCIAYIEDINRTVVTGLYLLNIITNVHYNVVDNIYYRVIVE